MEESSIDVLVRIHPSGFDTGELESQQQPQSQLVYDGRSIQVHREGKKATAEHTFTCVFGPATLQEEVYSECREKIQGLVQGVNTCIMAYGQTGSGKTYSMLGEGWDDLSISSSEGYGEDGFGIVPRAIADLISLLETTSNEKPSMDYSIHCQFMQIYNEKIYDLMQDKKRENPLQIKESARGSHVSVYVRGLSEYRINSRDDVMSLVERGLRNRAVRSTGEFTKSITF